MTAWARWSVALALVAALATAGCTPRQAVDNAAARAPAPTATTALPRTVAGPQETLNLPRRIPTPVPLTVRIHGQDWWIIGNTPWRGRLITVYYVPPENVVQDRDHYDLRSAVGVQRIATAQTRPDGTWTAVWSTRGVVHPQRPGIFLLARSDAGEYGLAHVTTAP
ncbi:MAG: hypothetical protein IRZ10_12925 [Thermoflavifilum sp.]|nr:hypothetical protein [Thermoflavifilum sp.]MCL6515299.1 hypothetical protein [Alicyclobacillus sp.]